MKKKERKKEKNTSFSPLMLERKKTTKKQQQHFLNFINTFKVVKSVPITVCKLSSENSMQETCGLERPPDPKEIEY